MSINILNCFLQSEDEDSDGYDNDGDFHDDEDTSWEDEGSEFSSSKNDGLPMKTV